MFYTENNDIEKFDIDFFFSFQKCIFTTENVCVTNKI